MGKNSNKAQALSPRQEPLLSPNSHASAFDCFSVRSAKCFTLLLFASDAAFWIVSPVVNPGSACLTFPCVAANVMVGGASACCYANGSGFFGVVGGADDSSPQSNKIERDRKKISVV